MSEWSNSTLGEVGEPVIGLTYSPKQISTDGTLVLRSSNIQDGRLALDDVVRVNAPIPDKLRCQVGDILICVRNGSRALIGKSIYLDKRTQGETFGAFMSMFRSPLNDYLRFFFQSDSFKRQVDEHLGATINQITNRSIRGFEVAFPTDARERNAIATVLIDMSALIDSLKNQMTKKRDIREGMIQELVTGRTRLPDFHSEWTRGTYRDWIDIKRGELFLSRNATPGGHVPVIAAGREPAAFTTAGNRRGPAITISASGASAGFVAFHDAEIFASDCSTVESNQSADLHFVYYTMLLRQTEIYRAQTGGAQPHVHANDIYPIVVEYPSDVTEQHAIAQILKDSDDEIAVLAKQIKSTSAIKQGMMQELLTGRTRLLVEVGAA